jgi:hypothetical protein
MALNSAIIYWSHHIRDQAVHKRLIHMYSQIFPKLFTYMCFLLPVRKLTYFVTQLSSTSLLSVSLLFLLLKFLCFSNDEWPNLVAWSLTSGHVARSTRAGCWGAGLIKLFHFLLILSFEKLNMKTWFIFWPFWQRPRKGHGPEVNWRVISTCFLFNSVRDNGCYSTLCATCNGWRNRKSPRQENQSSFFLIRQFKFV